MEIPIEDTAEALKALADPVRLRILQELRKAPKEKTICVCDLASKIGISQPNVSHHLKALKVQGFVTCEKDERFAYYSVNKAKIEAVFELVLRNLD